MGRSFTATSWSIFRRLIWVCQKIVILMGSLGFERHSIFRRFFCLDVQITLEDEMDKTTLLNTIQTEYAQFESLIAPLSETQLCTAPFEGEWSIKDIMAHIAVWEQLCTRWLEEFLRGVTPQPSERLD